MRTISVNLPDTLYRKFRSVTRQKDIEIEAGALEAINEFVCRESEYESDPFFSRGYSGRSGVRDVSKKHDLYLYKR